MIYVGGREGRGDDGVCVVVLNFCALSFIFRPGCREFYRPSEDADWRSSGAHEDRFVSSAWFFIRFF